MKRKYSDENRQSQKEKTVARKKARKNKRNWD